MAGGRRHAYREEELCEDTACLHFFDEGAIFFLADGTSDEASVGPFSSRYLANSLGYYFVETFLESHLFQDNGGLPKNVVSSGRVSFPPPSPLLRELAIEDRRKDAHSSGGFSDIVSIFHEAWERLSRAWKKEFDFFTGKEDNRDLLKKALVPYKDKNNRQSGHLLSFSTTFCAGVLQHEGRSLNLIKVGDLDIAVKDKENPVHRLNSHRERLFVQLISCSPKEEIKIVFPALKYKERSFRGVEFIVAKSDGVRFINDDISFNLINSGKKDNLLKFRKLLTKGYDRNIGDDKALLYLIYLSHS